MSESGVSGWLRSLRTARHFPVASVLHRLDLKIRRKGFRPSSPPHNMAEQWLDFQKSTGWLLPATFPSWQQRQDCSRSQSQEVLNRLLRRESGYLLNEFFTLFKNPQHLKETLPVRTPLWRENYGYLEFLLPLVIELRENPEPEKAEVLVEQLQLFWQLPFKERTWSTYGVSRRLNFYCECLPLLEYLTVDIQQQFWSRFYEEADFLSRFLEKDIRGNHLVKNYHAMLCSALVLEKIPACRDTAQNRLRNIRAELPVIFRKQLLPDGFHHERTPMYHVWVLLDLLGCLGWIKQEKPDWETGELETTARIMLTTLTNLCHTSRQIPQFGDSALLQAPSIESVQTYATEILEHGAPSEDTSPAAHYFPNAQFCILKTSSPQASLIIDAGDFGPRFLPAHSHCDIGSFEVHVANTPIIVDPGISEYVPSLMRDYFRGTAAHNTIWIPGEEQAEVWGSFRVAEYPHIEKQEYEQDEASAKITVAYENYNSHYHHQRSVYSVNHQFWVVQDWINHLKPEDRACYSLLHLHPECEIQYENEIFTLANKLLVIPYGFKKLEWSDQSPWRENLNLYSPGFNKAQPGKLLALTPKLEDCFGWVIIPYTDQKPHSEKRGESVEIDLQGHGTYLLTWESEGLKTAFRASTV